MAKYSNNQLIEMSKPYFDNSEIDMMWATQDGNFFYPEGRHHASAQAKRRKLDVPLCIKRGDYDLLVSQNKAVEEAKEAKKAEEKQVKVEEVEEVVKEEEDKKLKEENLKVVEKEEPEIKEEVKEVKKNPVPENFRKNKNKNKK